MSESLSVDTKSSNVCYKHVEKQSTQNTILKPSSESFFASSSSLSNALLSPCLIDRLKKLIKYKNDLVIEEKTVTDISNKENQNSILSKGNNKKNFNKTEKNLLLNNQDKISKIKAILGTKSSSKETKFNINTYYTPQQQKLCNHDTFSKTVESKNNFNRPPLPPKKQKLSPWQKKQQNDLLQQQQHRKLLKEWQQHQKMWIENKKNIGNYKNTLINSKSENSFFTTKLFQKNINDIDTDTNIRKEIVSTQTLVRQKDVSSLPISEESETSFSNSLFQSIYSPYSSCVTSISTSKINFFRRNNVSSLFGYYPVTSALESSLALSKTINSNDSVIQAPYSCIKTDVESISSSLSYTPSTTSSFSITTITSSPSSSDLFRISPNSSQPKSVQFFTDSASSAEKGNKLFKKHQRNSIKVKNSEMSDNKYTRCDLNERIVFRNKDYSLTESLSISSDWEDSIFGTSFNYYTKVSDDFDYYKYFNDYINSLSTSSFEDNLNKAFDRISLSSTVSGDGNSLSNNEKMINIDPKKCENVFKVKYFSPENLEKANKSLGLHSYNHSKFFSSFEPKLQLNEDTVQNVAVNNIKHNHDYLGDKTISTVGTLCSVLPTKNNSYIKPNEFHESEKFICNVEDTFDKNSKTLDMAFCESDDSYKTCEESIKEEKPEEMDLKKDSAVTTNNDKGGFCFKPETNIEKPKGIIVNTADKTKKLDLKDIGVKIKKCGVFCELSDMTFIELLSEVQKLNDHQLKSGLESFGFEVGFITAVKRPSLQSRLAKMLLMYSKGAFDSSLESVNDKGTVGNANIKTDDKCFDGGKIQNVCNPLPKSKNDVNKMITPQKSQMEKKLKKYFEPTLEMVKMMFDENNDPNFNRLIYEKLEDGMSQAFMKPIKSAQKGKKNFFNYLLLDPRITVNLPTRVIKIGQKKGFFYFIKSIFYVGKGQKNRPFEHFKEAALKKCKKTKPSNSGSSKTNSNGYLMSSPKKSKASNIVVGYNSKVATILEIWNEGFGVISLNFFQNSLSVEALTREACMIEAIGLSNITNVCKGQLHGGASNWNMKQIRQLGCWLLWKAYMILLYEGERQIRYADVS